jgi:hypothetical protein
MGLKTAIITLSPDAYWSFNGDRPTLPLAGSLTAELNSGPVQASAGGPLCAEAGGGYLGLRSVDTSHLDFGVGGLNAICSAASVVTAIFAIRRKSGNDAGSTGNNHLLWKTMNGNASGLTLNLPDAAKLRIGGRSVSSDSFQSAVTTSDLPQDEWVLVFAEWDFTGKTLKIWVDNTLEASASSVAFANNAYTQGSPTRNDFFGTSTPTLAAATCITADIAHWAFLKRALTPTERSELMAAWNERPEFTGSITESLPVGRWKVSAHRADTGEFVNSVSVTGASYTLPVNSYDPHTLTLEPFDYPWTANKAVSLGDYVVPTDADATPHVFEVTTAGDLGATEPSYNLAGTTSSGTAVLTYVGSLVTPLSLGPKVPD